MNDIRRTILWVIFGFSSVLLWDQWQIYNGNKPTFFPSNPAATQTAKGPAPASSSVPSAVTGTTPSTVPGAAAVPGGPTITAVPSTQPSAPAAPAQKVVVTTDVARLTFDTEGGSLVRTELLKISSDAKTGTFVLLDDSPNLKYVAESGLIGGDFPTHKTVMSVSAERELKEGANELNVRFESPEKGGVKLVKTYTLKRGAYDVAVRHEIVNTGTAPVSPQLYLQLVRDSSKLPGESSFYSTFTGPAAYTEAKKFHKIDFSDIDKGKAEIDKESTNGYVAMVQHYFASAWILPDGVKRQLFVR